MYKQLLEKRKSDFEKAIEHLNQELSGIRTGRASPALVENIAVESYGTASPLKNIASVSIPSSRSIAIQPWDKTLLSAIEKAIQASSLGIQPINDGAYIRLNLPPLSEERRVEMKKIVKQYAENTRIRVRNIREEIWRDVTNLFKEKRITEDEKYQAQEELNKAVEGFNEQIKIIAQKKEEEIMTV